MMNREVRIHPEFLFNNLMYRASNKSINNYIRYLLWNRIYDPLRNNNISNNNISNNLLYRINNLLINSKNEEGQIKWLNSWSL